MKIIKRILVTILALVVGFVGGAVFALTADFSIFGNTGESYNEKIITEKLTEISELSTLQDTYTGYIENDFGAKTLKGYRIPLTDKSIKLEYEATVKMGPDLAAMDVAVDNETSTITVTIPHSKILSFEVNEDSFKALDIKNGLFNRVKFDDNTAVRKKLKSVNKKRIIEDGRLDEADEKAVNQIKSFLEAAYPDANIEVNITE